MRGIIDKGRLITKDTGFWHDTHVIGRRRFGLCGYATSDDGVEFGTCDEIPLKYAKFTNIEALVSEANRRLRETLEKDLEPRYKSVEEIEEARKNFE